MLRLNPQNSMSRPTTSLTTASGCESPPPDISRFTRRPYRRLRSAGSQLARDSAEHLAGGARRQAFERFERSRGLMSGKRANSVASARGRYRLCDTLGSALVAATNGLHFSKEGGTLSQCSNEGERDLALDEIAQERLPRGRRVA